MNVEIGTVAVQFLFWEYLFRIFAIGTMQCRIRSFCIIYSKGDFFVFMYCIQHCFIRRPSDSSVSKDAGIVPCRTVATSALTVRRSNHSARSHPQVLS
jgi:hypothetical protein